MTTPPLSDDLIANLKRATAWRFEGQIGDIFTPRFFCCDNPNDLGISEGKEPVAKFTLTPSPAFVGDTVNYDGTDSYDPDGSITGYAWSFEGHTPSSGTASAGTLVYSTAGTYTVQLTVTDGTGLKSAPARKELIVADRLFFTAYYVGGSTGVFYSDQGGTANYTDRNAGLDGDALTVYDVAIDPATQLLPEANKTVWRVAVGNVNVSNDGGATWASKPPASVPNDWSDGTAPTVADVSFRQLHFRGERLFLLGDYQNGSSEYRSYLWYTDNAPDMRSDTSGSVTWTQVNTTWET